MPHLKMGMVSGTRSRGVLPLEFLITGKYISLHPLHILIYLYFLHRGPAAKATQGVPKSVHKLFGTRGEAIIAYQVALLRGEVFLANEKVDKAEE